MIELREVYLKIGTEIENKVPKEFVEYEDFWKTVKCDKGYIMVYLNKDNQIVQ